MDENELLLRHAQRWAADHGRPFDRDLVARVLDLRSTHDGLAANLWPAGSAAHLMVQRWPAHGPVEPPDIAAFTGSLDTFWRFLRSTGRLASASAEPAQLRKEATNAAPQMAKACADPSRWGSAKSVLAFGEQVGISLDDAETIDELQDRLDRIGAAWNDLPEDERHRRTAHLDDLVGATNDLDPKDAPVPAPEASEVAPYVRDSGFTQALAALAAWVGEGREITSIGVLRPALAREAYADLDLWPWEREWRRIGGAGEPDRPATWRSAADCAPLERLWQSAVAGGLILLNGRRATVALPAPTSDEGWAGLGVSSVMNLVAWTDQWVPAEALLSVLVALDDNGADATMEAHLIKDWWWTLHSGESAEVDDEAVDPERSRRETDRDIDQAVFLHDDCGLWTHLGSRLQITPLGSVVGAVLAHILDPHAS